MVKVIMGLKGMGKTKSLIEMVNTAVKEDNGDVICIEKGTKLTFDVNHSARLIDVSQYDIKTYDEFLAFINGLLSGNNDITSVYIDSLLKFCPDDMAALGKFLDKLADITSGKSVVITISYDSNLATPEVKKYF